ncbi:PstS family phosphate ABC transporter substrate-binding protein [Granulicella tundricola]|uniref:Phosphate ABC transporter periplasmic phosphate-binding protein n=1 Tax=Granulicella tundricola (strain ATCC BAA-1859 / DSM 23138 / MP5ACTX9) TaxID=1198114 RepID=E8WYI3_GRATM|nr:substrate-binding domain-containing protein [Granulicella tundricola]ADW67581.1 phosphate ABC transporter periplasmic phosphate-binding protein [Granulicella tundricola MP5ACTX9]
MTNLTRRAALLTSTLVLSACCAATSFAQMFDPQQLRPYKPDVLIKGGIIIVGGGLKGQVELWEKGFQKFHPDATFGNNFTMSSEGAIPALYLLGADVAPAGDDAKVSDYLAFYETKHYFPTEIAVATGHYETRGALWAIQIVVNKDNPLAKLSLKQLDGIFGAARTGGWDGIFYSAKWARPASENIRTWGQLGLTGEWANKPIQTYGYIAPGFKYWMERRLFHNGDKWNENYKEYVEGRQTVPGDPEGKKVDSERMYEELSKDKYGIAWGPILHSKNYPNVKQIDLSENGGPYVALTPDNVKNRTYPLKRDAYIYIDQHPGKPMDDRAKEFMKYILSREGQEDVKNFGFFYPLPQNVIDEQLKLIR